MVPEGEPLDFRGSGRVLVTNVVTRCRPTRTTTTTTVAQNATPGFLRSSPMVAFYRQQRSREGASQVAVLPTRRTSASIRTGADPPSRFHLRPSSGANRGDPIDSL